MRLAENIAFSIGFVALIGGVASLHWSFGLIAFGVIVCGLLIWKRIRPIEADKGGDDA